jgi:hypothetical protein
MLFGMLDRPLLARVAAVLGIAAVVGLVFVLTLGSSGDDDVGPAEVEAAAFRWVGVGIPEDPRRDGDEWEVDVERPNGSLVEVTMDDQLEMIGIDEELGPRGTPAWDELAGERRRRAEDTALEAVGPGRVSSVERESQGSIEVKVRRAGELVEVQIEGGEVVEIEEAHPGDE